MQVESIAGIFDVLLAGSLVILGWLAVSGISALRAIIFFVAFGMLMAVTWARLDAPDLALAEAAIGAGLTGALFMKAAHAFGGVDRPGRRVHSSVRAAAPLLAGAAVVVIARTVLSLPEDGVALTGTVAESLQASGVVNPVTAVLLNFRGYDTLLEMAVLTVAALACWSADGGTTGQLPREPHLEALVRFLTPLLILVAGYMVWTGSKAPGGAFQAGALIGGGGVLRLLLGGVAPANLVGRIAAVVGVVTFAVIGALVSDGGSAFLRLRGEAAGPLVLAIEGACAISVGYLLVMMYQAKART